MTPAPDLSTAQWTKSSYSSGGGQCIEPALHIVQSQNIVPVRDSKDPAGPALIFPASASAAFATATAEGKFGDV
ncbi:DUF397 domain-containing protein [Kitasatospora sp. NPDC101801]|uniref:DUF397 domain-containing protein n=1 Tax=Kitasatospora sp. NPDC101801 TaxID=3364103 RepID=UPI0038035446